MVYDIYNPGKQDKNTNNYTSIQDSKSFIGLKVATVIGVFALYAFGAWLSSHYANKQDKQEQIPATERTKPSLLEKDK
jgi:hypothetical protein